MNHWWQDYGEKVKKTEKISGLFDFFGEGHKAEALGKAYNDLDIKNGPLLAPERKRRNDA